MTISASRLEALQVRHNALSHKIEEEQASLAGSDWYLKSLKQQRLHLKEQIEGIDGR